LTTTTIQENNAFSRLATTAQIERTALALEANGMHVLISENGDQARKLFFELVPEGSQIYQGSSLTLDTLGITSHIEQSGCFDAIRPKLRRLDRQTQSDQIRQLGASPDYMVGSINAITEDGRVLVASASGSQLGPYVSGAKKVIWVVGAQKLVKDLDEGLRRIEEYVLPLENERLLKVYGMNTSLNKILIFNKERPGRITIILVKENLGF
jgi:acyl-CoA hydrolase